MTKKESIIVLLSVTLCWSSSYLFIKGVPESFNTFAYLAITSGIAGVTLALVFHRHLMSLKRHTLIHGSILALLITGNMFFEKLALNHLPASSVSSLAAMNIVIVPLILLFRRHIPSRNNVVGVAIIVVGIVVSNAQNFQAGSPVGVVFVILSSLCMSFYTVIASDFTDESSPLLLTIVQLLITAAIGFGIWVATTPDPFAHLDFSSTTVSHLFILAFFSKAYAYVMLMYAEKYANPLTITVMAATDPVVTLLLAICIPSLSQEAFTLQALVGAVVITLGAIVAGTNFLSRPQQAAAQPDGQAAGVQADAEQSEVHRVSALWIGAIVTMLFVSMGVSITIMRMSDGFTKLRPENCLSVPSGIMLGPIGGLACSVGNLFADLFFDFGDATWLGFVGNFIMAFLPYKLWKLTSADEPNAHTWQNLARYTLAAAVGSMACASYLAISLDEHFALWYEKISMEIFLNNFLFSMAIGLPTFIVLTSERVQVVLKPKTGIARMLTYGSKTLAGFGGLDRTRTAALVVCALLVTLQFVLTSIGFTPTDTFLLGVLSFVVGSSMLVVFLLPVKGYEELELESSHAQA